jgi:hypothetical protein
MIQCDVCPSEADVQWSAPTFRALTPMGIEITEKITALEGHNIQMCATCFKRLAGGLSAEAAPEQRRRMLQSS